MDLTSVLSKQLDIAYQGRELWINFINQVNLQDQEYVILFPSSNENLNYYGLLYLNQFIESKKSRKTYIITSDEKVKKAINVFTDKIENCFLMKMEEVDKLLHFYTLYMFTDKLIVVSLDELPGRSLENLLGIRGVTLEELISIGIYQLREFKKERLVHYKGKDTDLNTFFNINNWVGLPDK